MFLTEFNEEEYLEMVREEEREEGFLAGRIAGRRDVFFETLSEIGEITPDIKKMAEEAEVEILKSWTKLAARADSMEEFLEKIR